jgi:hypothetical protein
MLRVREEVYGTVRVGRFRSDVFAYVIISESNSDDDAQVAVVSIASTMH